ncbi:MAG TPA: POTRA domain-containing protein [Thermoanaerobaculia bacterium]
MRRAHQRLLLALGLAGTAAFAMTAPIAQDLFGRPVASVALTVDGEIDRRQIESLIAIRTGSPLSEDDTAATIRNLYGTLQFADVLIEAEPAEGGEVAVTVHLWKAFRVRLISFSGKSTVSREDMRRVVPLLEGDPFNAAALAEGASGLERRLSTEGYLHPVIDPDVSFEPDTFSVSVVYRIAAGERARVAPPFFDGSTSPFEPEQLLRKAHLKVGARYRETKARADADRFRKFLLEKGYWKANVELIAAEPTDDGRVRPVYRIAVGPRVEIAATGISEKRVRREFLSLLPGQSFDADLLQQWVDKTRQDLQRRGHYRARLDATTSEGSSSVTVKVTEEKGAKYSVEKIVFSGNSSVEGKTLRGLMVTRKRGLPLLQKGRLIDTDLDEDVSAILGYYQTHGWIDARINKPAVTEGSRPSRLQLEIAIVEGPRTYVASRRVEGAEHLTREEVDRLLTVREGQPFNPSAVRQDVFSLTSHYWNTGWREASVQDSSSISQDRTRVNVEYRVAEGTRSFFGKTIVRGNAVTHPNRILRQVAWKEGDPYSEEKIADTQKNLARTGVFRSIEIRPQPIDPENQSRSIDIGLSEARRFSLLYGFGYQNAPGAAENRNDGFAIVGGTYRNLFGSMRSTSLEIQYAPISKRGHVFATFIEPYLFNTDVPLTFVAFLSREPIQDIDIDRQGGYLESVRLFPHYLRVGLRYEYQQIKPNNPEDLSTIELEKFPRSDRPIKQSAIGPNLLYDRRDDILDPHRGYYWTLAGKYAFPLFAADARYGKVSAQGAWFTRLANGVLGASIKAGAIFPYDLEAKIPVPIAERFFSGGSASGRGFDTDLLGIPGVTVDYDTQATLHTGSGTGSCAATFPNLSEYDCNFGPRIIGGNGFMAWSLEYRFPILGNLGVSVFYELAQVWEHPEDIRFAIEGKEGMRQSMGAGLHYLTPIGPLRLEYGLPVERRTIDFNVTTTDKDGNVIILGRGSTKESGRVLLSIGYPF